MTNQVSSLDPTLSALADPTRRQVFESLCQAAQPVGKLAAGLPVSRPAVSQHLKVLSDAGLVEFRAEGTRNIYMARRDGLAGLRHYLNVLWGDVLDGLAAEIDKQGGD
ncbi:MAG: winged helix-turn-helix transcriptional regulator [Rhodobacteraceae bacterium]|nr:winged helix-turn-helix transcriptional regulator [Paracoccaceae bacterium]